MSIWNKLQYFTKKENWGNPDKIDPSLLFVLDAVRDLVGHSFIINCGYKTDGHAKNSQHYQGKAVDFYVKGIPFKEAYEKINQALLELNIQNEVGFGVYPQWEIPGFHLDVRGTRARWGFADGKYVGLEYAMTKAK